METQKNMNSQSNAKQKEHSQRGSITRLQTMLYCQRNKDSMILACVHTHTHTHQRNINRILKYKSTQLRISFFFKGEF